MKLASYVADGKPCFGVVAGDGVITMNQRLGGRYAGRSEEHTSELQSQR